MKYAKIGGQAVIEGVMMRYGNDYAVTVRKPNGELEIRKDTYNSLVNRLHVGRVPVVRGVFSFVDSLILGMSTLTYSAGFYEEEEPVTDAKAGPDERKAAADTADGQPEGSPAGTKEGTRAQTAKTADEKKKKLLDDLMMAGTVVLAVILAVGLFMILPFLVSDFCGRFISSSWVLGILEGVVRIVIFMAYLILITWMPDIQRTFMYHGAEHKSISCIEHGDELTPENAMKHSRFHKRCGTSFLFLVVFLSVIVFILFFQIFPVESRLLKIVIRLLMVPVIAGVAYEILQWAGRHDGKLSDAISKPGLWMQRLTTREPDEGMLETAIASIEAIYDWRAFQEEVRAKELSAPDASASDDGSVPRVHAVDVRTADTYGAGKTDGRPHADRAVPPGEPK